MAALGTTTLYVMLLLSAWACALAIVGARRRSPALMHSAEMVSYAVTAAASLAMLVLAYAFVVSDFSLTYVQQHSDRSMPVFYRITATWGGMEGSLLLWAWLLALFTGFAIRSNRERLREMLPHVTAVLMVVMVFFGVLLVTTSNPFGTYLINVPATGKGLNPLLQNPYMVTHPPALYLGFVGMAIPFAFGMGALLSGHLDDAWIRAARRWAMLAWFFLSLGLTLGMLWAYEELGWGGYWGWDPVENAGFLPWLACTAFLHSIIVQERRGMLRIWNQILVIIAFTLTIFGTFLTRSGFIESVHAFARSNIGYVFLAFIGLTFIVGIALVIWRLPQLRSRGELESVMSREFWFLLNNWVLLTATVLVMVLTIFPNISELFGEKITISIPAFNRWMVPIGVALLILTGVGPMLGWRKSTVAGMRRQFTWPLVAGIAAMGVLWLLGLRRMLPVAVWGLCAFVLATIVQELVRASIMRSRASGISWHKAFVGLFARDRRRYGGYIVHVGIVLMCIGFAGESFKLEDEVVMQRGQRHTIGRYTLRFDGIGPREDAQKQMVVAKLSVYEDGHFVGPIEPARWIFFKHEDQPTTEVALRRSLREDLFVALGSHDSQSGATTFKFIVNPLVNWIWIGFLVMTFGAALAALPLGFLTRRRSAAAALALLLMLAPFGVARAGPTDPGGGGAVATADEHTAGAVKLNTEGEASLFSGLSCMCGTCPRIPLDKCQCGFAQQERSAIRGKLAAGWTENRILDWYVNQRGPEIGKKPFGSGVLTTPPDSTFNRLYWLIPYSASGLAVVALVLLGRRWSRRKASTQPAATAIATATTTAAGGDDADPYRELLEEELTQD